MVTFNFYLDIPYKRDPESLDKISKLKKARKAITKSLLSERETAIYLIVTFPKGLINPNAAKLIKIHTGERVYPKNWDFNTKLPTSHGAGAMDLTERLQDFKANVNRAYNEYMRSNASVSIGSIEQLLKRSMFEKIGSINTNDFYTTFDKYLAVIKESNPHTNYAASPRTIQKYNSLKTILQDFEVKKNYSLTFESINTDFIAKYNNYLEGIYAKNTKQKHIADLKTFLRWSYSEDYHKNQSFEKLKAKRVKTLIIKLTYEEIRKLYAYKPELESLKRVKDVFLFQFLTGQRYSDIDLLKWKALDLNNKVWTLYQYKGDKDTPLTIPLHDYALKILAKYKGEEKPLPVISNQRYNEHVKTLCQKAGITSLINLKDSEEPIPKHKLISSHTARKSVINIMGFLGVEESLIKSITGHTKKGAYHESYREHSREELLTAINKISFDNIGRTLLKVAV